MNQKIFVLLTIVIIISGTVATTYSLRILEQKEDLSVKIIAYPSTGTAPFNVSFSSFVTDDSGDIKYHWDFGNDQQSNENKPMVIYYDKGEYICSLKVTDANGKTGSDSLKIVVNKNKPPVVTLSINMITINREFNWLELLSLTPIASWAGNKQLFLDSIEEQKGADAWGKGRINVTAQIMDPEDDEIVSYDWKVQTADKVVTNYGVEWLPIKNLTGEKKVRIPELYTWLDDRHIVVLTVTDSAGNKATANIDYMVSASSKLTKIRSALRIAVNVLPFIGLLWGLQFIKNPVTNILDGIWFNLPPMLQNLTLKFLTFIKWEYDPPIPKADLEFSEIADINLSHYVNDTTGEVQSGATANSSFIIFNNDSTNISENIFITLKNPITNEQGLKDELEIEAFSADIIAGIISTKLFYKENYTIWEDCYNIEKLSPGDANNLQLKIALTKGAIVNKGSYDCKLYIFQSKSLHKAEYVDEIPFKIII